MTRQAGRVRGAGAGPGWGMGWGRGEGLPRTAGAVSWLQTQLAKGPVLATVLREAAAAEGYGDYALQFARRRLGVIVWREGHHWRWGIPAPRPPRATSR